MPKLLMLRAQDGHFKALHAAAPGWQIVFARGEEALPHMKDAQIIAGWSSRMEEAISQNPNLKWVQNWGAGVDSLPLSQMKARGIHLTTASGVHPKPIAESALAMMLSFSRGLVSAARTNPGELWQRRMRVWEMHGMTLGILGPGAIGQELARLARAFGMTVLGYRRQGGGLSGIDQMYGGNALSQMLERCDYVVNLLPLTSATRGMVGEAQFAAMKESAVYISCGRGATTDTAALIKALSAGQIAFAGLDVTDPEPLPGDSPLYQMDNVLITPHNSGLTQHYDARAMEIFMENLRAYLESGRPVRNVVDFEREY